MAIAACIRQPRCAPLFRIFAAIGSNIRNVKRILLNFEFSHYLLT